MVSYSRDQWTSFASLGYIQNLFGGEVNGKVGDMDTDEIKTGNGIVDFSLGGVYKFSKRFSADAKLNFRAGGAESIGGQLGANFKF